MPDSLHQRIRRVGQLALPLAVVGHQRFQLCPEAGAVVQFRQVGQLVGNHVVDQLGGILHQPPVETDAAVAAAAAPAGAGGVQTHTAGGTAQLLHEGLHPFVKKLGRKFLQPGVHGRLQQRVVVGCRATDPQLGPHLSYLAASVSAVWQGAQRDGFAQQRDDAAVGIAGASCFAGHGPLLPERQLLHDPCLVFTDGVLDGRLVQSCTLRQHHFQPFGVDPQAHAPCTRRASHAIRDLLRLAMGGEHQRTRRDGGVLMPGLGSCLALEGVGKGGFSLGEKAHG